MTLLRWGSSTDVGVVRESNQDSFLVAEPLFAVADGMGGHNGGEVASATALEILEASFDEPTKEALLEAVRRANAKVWDKAQLDDSLRNMGTTLTAVAKVHDEEGNETLAVVNVGDSRAYLYREGELSQVTSDHSLVEEMVRAGEITAADAETHPRRNILTRALGVEPTVEVDIDLVVPQPGDRFIICSDGLVREVTDDQIASVLRRIRDPQEAVHELVAQAKAHGGHDNITVVIIDIEPDENEVPVTSAPAAKSNNRAQPTKTASPRLPRATTPSARRITLRVLLFILAVLALLAFGVGSVVWYARSSFFVGLEGQQLVIFRGRPDPVLWFKPTLAARTDVTTDEVLPRVLPDLQEGAVQASLEEAHQYILNLTGEATAARQAAAPLATPETAVPPPPAP